MRSRLRDSIFSSGKQGELFFMEYRNEKGTKKIKLADIATALDVSVVTVSKALSGQKGVSEEMREQIRNLANELGYKQPSAKKAEGSAHRFRIGMMIPERCLGKYDTFYWKLCKEVNKCSVKLNHNAQMEILLEEQEAALEIPHFIREKKVDGLLFIGKPEKNYWKSLREILDIPVVTLESFDQNSNSDAVISDCFYGAYMLTNYLFQMGHEKIAYVGTLLYNSSITDRYLGYCKAMMEHGENISELQVIRDRNQKSDIVTEESFALSENEMPTAFVCNNDDTASILIRRLRREGYRIPQDISVVGFDNYQYPGMCDIGITTYEVGSGELAKRALELLIRKIKGEPGKKGVRIGEGRIVYKESVKQIG